MPGLHPGVQTRFLEPGPTQCPPTEPLSQAGRCWQCPRAPQVSGQGTPTLCQGQPSQVSLALAERRPPPALLCRGSRSEHPSVSVLGHRVGPEPPQQPLGAAPVGWVPPTPLQRGQKQLQGGKEGAAIAGRWQGPRQLAHSERWRCPQTPSVGSGALLCPLAAPGHQLKSLLTSAWHHVSLVLLHGGLPEQGDARSQDWGHPQAGRAELRQQAPFCQATVWETASQPLLCPA